MSQMTPFQKVQDQHGTKEKLVDKIVGVLERGEESKDDLRTKLQTASNSKLLHLFATATEVKERFGSREKLVDAILVLLGRQKDGDYRERLLGFSPARLLDRFRAAERRARKASRPTA